MKHTFLVSVAAGVLIGFGTTGPGLVRALSPDHVWCSTHHMICHWGGAMEPDPAYWGEEASMDRLVKAVRAAIPPQPAYDPAVPGDAVVPVYPQIR